MAVYANRKTDAAITQVEFASTPGGQLVFLHVKQAGLGEVRGWLAKQRQTVIGEMNGQGETTLIVRTDQSQQNVLQLFAGRSDRFDAVTKSQKVDPWVIRSLLGFGGQGLQLASSFMRHAKFDIPLLTFAASNLTANGINLAYRAQERDDPHRLKFLKQRLNERFGKELAQGESAPDVNDHRYALRQESKRSKTRTEGFNEFMQKNSVNVGELGLRYIGAAGLAVPPQHWGNMLKGQLPKASQLGGLRSVAGFTSIAGKTVALSSVVEDPYNPKPKSWLDNFREKFSFLTGGWIETCAFSVLSYDAFMNTSPKKLVGVAPKGAHIDMINGVAHDVTRAWKFNGGYHRDWLSAVGAAMFVTGYIVRAWAKYGERKVDMNELYAHVSDTLAKAPADKRGQLLAEAAAEITTHFAHDKKPVEYATVYSAIAGDLEKHHRIALDRPAPVEATREPLADRSGPGNRIALPAEAKTLADPAKTTARDQSY